MSSSGSRLPSPRRVPEPYRVAVLAAGGGSNLQAILDACAGNEPAQVVLVLSNNPGAKALERALTAGVAAGVIHNPADGATLTRTLREAGVDLVVLAGYLKLVPAETVKAFEGRIINIHPALLPAFGGPGMYGSRVHQAVLDSGAKMSGATVHHVGTEYDRGEIVAQRSVPVMPGDTPETLAARVLDVEHQLLPEVVLAAARAGKVVRLGA